jgi:hypothetical protein
VRESASKRRCGLRHKATLHELSLTTLTEPLLVSGLESMAQRWGYAKVLQPQEQPRHVMALRTQSDGSAALESA